MRRELEEDGTNLGETVRGLLDLALLGVQLVVELVELVEPFVEHLLRLANDRLVLVCWELLFWDVAFDAVDRGRELDVAALLGLFLELASRFDTLAEHLSEGALELARELASLFPRLACLRSVSGDGDSGRSGEESSQRVFEKKALVHVVDQKHLGAWQAAVEGRALHVVSEARVVHQLGVDHVHDKGEKRPRAEQVGKDPPLVGVVGVRDDVKPGLVAAARGVHRKEDGPQDESAKEAHVRPEQQVPEEKVAVHAHLLEHKALGPCEEVGEPAKRRGC